MRSCLATRLVVVTAAVVSAMAASGQTLAELEQAARANALNVRIAHEDTRLQQYRLDAAEAQHGPAFNGNAGLADAREPVTDTEVRAYRRASAQVGVRWPLLEGAQAQERAQIDARGALEVSRLRARQAEIDAVLEVRLAYVDYRRANERAGLAEALLRLESGAMPILAARTRQTFLLEADRRELGTIFEMARRDVERAGAVRDDALRRIRRSSAIAEARPATEPPRWDTSCVTAAPLLARVDERPTVALASMALTTREALAKQLQWTGVDAGVSLTQSASRDIGSLSGRSTGVSVDVTVPFGWRALRDARKAEAETHVRRARLELDAAREADAANVDQLVRELRVREADRAAALQRLDSAQEALRVAEARLRRLDGDVIEKVLRARHGVYATAIEMSDALQRLERAQAATLAVTESCTPAGAAIEPAQWDLLPTLLAQPIMSPAGHTSSTTETTEPSGLGWYVWNAAPWLAAPVARLAELPLSTQRVLLGFDAAQLRALATPSGAKALGDLVAHAHARRVSIELLLGDPQWVLQRGRGQLLAILRPIAELAFDGLNLDLERDQLPHSQRKAWPSGVVATIAAVRAIVRWPIGLTTHDRDLRDTTTNRHLQAAGANELIALAYTTNRARALQRARDVIDAAPGLRVSLGQSVERELPADSSLFKRGRAAALADAEGLARALGDTSAATQRFGGIVIQSFEAFEGAPP